VRGCVAHQGVGFGDVGQRMADVSGAEIPVFGRCGGQVRVARGQKGFQGVVELVQGGAFTHGHVVDLVEGIRVLGEGGQEVCLDRVVDVAEVPAGLAVPVDVAPARCGSWP
jgi:hypothetical protein